MSRLFKYSLINFLFVAAWCYAFDFFTSQEFKHLSNIAFGFFSTVLFMGFSNSNKFVRVISWIVVLILISLIFTLIFSTRELF